MLRAVAALALASLSGGAAMAQMLPFEGRWALQADRCAPAAGSTEPGQPITLTAKHLLAPPVMTCDFTSVLPGGTSFRVEAVCVAGREKGNEFFTLAVMNGRLYWSWGDKTQEFERCPD